MEKKETLSNDEKKTKIQGNGHNFGLNGGFKFPWDITLPNIITLVRLFLLSPLLFVSGFMGWGPVSFFLYLVAILTDFFDGRIARATGATSYFGRAMDSVGDKIVVTAALLGFVVHGNMFVACFLFAFLLREFFVFGLRAIKTTKKGVAAINDTLGRIRFFVLHLGILLIFFSAWIPVIAIQGLMLPVDLIGIALTSVAIFLAYVSLFYYVNRDIEVIKSTMRRTYVYRSN